MNAKKNAESQEYDNPPEPGDSSASTSQQTWEEPTVEAAADVGEQSMAEDAAKALGVTDDIVQAFQTVESWLMRRTSASEGQTFAAEDLAGAGNIVGVGFGRGESASGGEPGAAGLNVYVAEPSDVETVRAILANTMGVAAASNDAAPINVVVTGRIDAQPHPFKIRPAPGGVSVGHYKITAGTLGCLAVGRHAPWTNRLLVLSNNHVLANSNAAAAGDAILQPGAYDGGKVPADRIAILARWVPIAFGGAVNYVDCAYAWAWPNLVRKELVYVGGGALHYFRVSSTIRAGAVGMTVGKTGRTTQLKVGRIVDSNASVNVNYGGGRVALFRDQLVIQASSGQFSAGGDSGSLIWTWDSVRNPVGLLFAGSSTHTIANKIGRVVSALDINLYT